MIPFAADKQPGGGKREPGLNGISPWLLLAISVAAGLIGGIARNYYCKKVSGDLSDYHLLNAFCCLAGAAVLWAMNGFPALSASPFTTALGILFGTVTMLGYFTCSAALRTGPWSYTTVIISLAAIVPALSGAVFWHETISLLQVAGIVMMAACFVLSVNPAGEDRKVTARWLLFCLAAFCCSGVIGVLQKVHQSSVWRDELAVFLILSFLVAAAVSSAAYFISRKPRGAAVPKAALRPLLLCGLFIGVTAALQNQYNLYLSGVLPSAVFFPVVNGGGLVLTALVSVAVFREHLRPRQWTGVVLGIGSVMLLCL